MPRLTRQFLVMSLLALHATVMSCGPCLHGLPGLGHAAGLADGTDGDHGPDPAKAPHGLADDCPICHFFAQAQLPIDPSCLLMVRHVGVWQQETPYDTVTPERLHPTSPRAPPAPPTNVS